MRDYDCGLYKVAFAGICGSDTNRIKAQKTNNLLNLGHEIVCVSNGHYYVVNPFICDIECEECDAPSLMFCGKVSRLGIGDKESGFSGRIRVPERNMFAFDNVAHPEVGVLVDGVAVIFHALHLVDLSCVNRVAVIGAGSMGVLFAIVLKSILSQVSIDVPVRREEKRQYLERYFSKSFHTTDSASFALQQNSYDLVIEAVGGTQTQTLSSAVKAVVPNGRILVLGAFHELCYGISGIRELFYKQIQLQGVNSFCAIHNDFSNAVEWVINNESLLFPLITNYYTIATNNFSDKDIIKGIMGDNLLKGCFAYVP